MSLRASYTFWAPLYDWFLDPATRQARAANLASLGRVDDLRIALVGVGSGLDLPPLQALGQPACCTGVDLTEAMLARARPRIRHCSFPVGLVAGDAMTLPYRAAAFDVVILHLILAVVPDPGHALAEASRVLRPGGRILVFDKFLHPGQRAPLRRLVSPLLGRLATRTDVELEPLLANHPELRCTRDEPLLAGGWFRGITLTKEDA